MTEPPPRDVDPVVDRPSDARQKPYITSGLAKVRVVLVRPHYHGNLGSVARVMKNFGLRDLVLVDPIADPQDPQALMMAMRGTDILQQCRIVPTLAAAVADCGYVLATSGEIGGLRRQGFWGSPEEKLPECFPVLHERPAAILFGPEPSGLLLEEITQAHGMIFIPVEAEYPSLNLAQAVAVVLYELRRQYLRWQPESNSPGESSASFETQERLFAHLREALTAVRFLWDFRSEGIFHILRQGLARARLTEKEVMVWHGLAKQLLFVAKFWGVTHPRDGRPPQQRPVATSPPLRPQPGDKADPTNDVAVDPTPATIENP